MLIPIMINYEYLFLSDIDASRCEEAGGCLQQHVLKSFISPHLKRVNDRKIQQIPSHINKAVNGSIMTDA